MKWLLLNLKTISSPYNFFYQIKGFLRNVPQGAPTEGWSNGHIIVSIIKQQKLLIILVILSKIERYWWIRFIWTRRPKRYNNNKCRKVSLKRSSRCPNGRLKQRSHYVTIIKQQQNLLLVVILSKIEQYWWIWFIPTRRPKRHNNDKYRSKASIYNHYYYPAIIVSLQAVSFLVLLLFYLQITDFWIFIPPKNEHDGAQNRRLFTRRPMVSNILKATTTTK